MSSEKQSIEKLTHESLQNQPDALADIGRGEKYLKKDYKGRYVFELLQNIRDAYLQSGEGKDSVALFHVTETALIVANTGKPFDLESIESIRSIGKSTKVAPKFIGHKGIGFKSVFEITQNPQIFSAGFQIQFNREKTFQKLQEYGATIQNEPERHRFMSRLMANQKDLTVMHIPYWMDWDEVDSDIDLRLLKELHSACETVIRLPFLTEVTCDDVWQHLCSFQPEALLFLGCIKDVTFKNELTGEKRAFSVASEPVSENVIMATLRRAQGTGRAQGAAPTQGPSQVEKWLVFEKAGISLPPNLLTTEEREQFSASEENRIEIKVAYPLADTLDSLLEPDERVFYMYYPTEEHQPLPCLIHSWFQLKPARTHFFDSAMNEWLFDQIVEFLADTVCDWFKNSAEFQKSLPYVLVPEAVTSKNATLFSTRLLDKLKDTNFLPTKDYQNFVSPSSICLIPLALRKEQVGVSLAELFSEESLTTYFGYDCYFLAEEVELAGLLRTLGAGELKREAILGIVQAECVRNRQNPGWFNELYHLLMQATRILRNHSKKDTDAFIEQLRDKKILLSQGSHLYSANDSVKLFIPPADGVDFADLPRALAEQFEFVHPEIKVKSGDRQSETGNFLLHHQFIRPFEFLEIFEDGILPVMETYEKDWGEREGEKLWILRYVKDLFDKQGFLTRKQKLADFDGGGIRVPTKLPNNPNSSFVWKRADEVYFSSAWTGSDDLEKLYGDFDDVPFLAEAESLMIEESGKASWWRFFETIGVWNKPRVLQSSDGINYQINNGDFKSLERHPLSRQNPLWKSYLSYLKKLPHCLQSKKPICWNIHLRARQTFLDIYALDKFDKLLKQSEKLPQLFELLFFNWSFYSRFKTSQFECGEWGCRGKKRVESFFLFCLKNYNWIPTTLLMDEEIPVLLPPNRVWAISEMGMQSSLGAFLPCLQHIPPGFFHHSTYSAFVTDLSLNDLNSANVDGFLRLLRFAYDAYPVETIQPIQKRAFKDFYVAILRQLDSTIGKKKLSLPQHAALMESPLLAEIDDNLEYKPLNECYLANNKQLYLSLRSKIPFAVFPPEGARLATAMGLKKISAIVRQEATFGDEVEPATAGLRENLAINLPFLVALAEVDQKISEAERAARLRVLANVKLAVVNDLQVQTHLTEEVPLEMPLEPVISPFFLRLNPIEQEAPILYVNAPDADNLDTIANAFAALFREIWDVEQPYLEDAFLRFLKIPDDDDRSRYLEQKGIFRSELFPAEMQPVDVAKTRVQVCSTLREETLEYQPQNQGAPPSVRSDDAATSSRDHLSRLPVVDTSEVITPNKDSQSERQRSRADDFSRFDESVRKPLMQDLAEESQHAKQKIRGIPEPVKPANLIDSTKSEAMLKEIAKILDSFAIETDAGWEEYVPGEPFEEEPLHPWETEAMPGHERTRSPGEIRMHQKLGRIGEEYVFAQEKERLTEQPDLSPKVDWVSQQDDTRGYDILSFHKDGSPKYIEVKTTDREDDLQFPMSFQEWMKAAEIQSDYYIYRVVIDIQNRSAKVTVIKNPYQLWQENRLKIDFKEFYITLIS